MTDTTAPSLFWFDTLSERHVEFEWYIHLESCLVLPNTKTRDIVGTKQMHENTSIRHPVPDAHPM